MKRLLFFFAVLLISAVSTNAQTIVKGDMNGDGRLSVTDLTLIANTIVGKMDVETIDLTVFAYTVNNEKIVGRWYKSDGSYITFNADGTTDYPGGATYEYYPLRDRILVSDRTGSVIKTITLSAVTDVYMLVVDYSMDVTTCYVHSDYMVSELTLSESSLTMNSSATSQLSVTIAPSNAYNKNVVWSSSDESVATVDQNGLVTAVAGGTCTITCTATDGSGVSATCPVTVIQLVTGITLSETSLIMEMDDYKKLSAIVLPANANNNSVTWSSSDESVAVVAANGGVTALGYGTCVITCTATDGSGVTATCTITVTRLVTSITLNSCTLSIGVGETASLITTVLPHNALNQTVTWSSSDTSVATVDSNGLVTAVALGPCIITCAATDGSEVTATCKVFVVVPHDSNDYVDLGLPSGTLWATCNIGATSPGDYGDYFAWGETSGYKDGKTTFSWSNYTYCNGAEKTMTKYCNNNEYGYNDFTDTLTELELEDDAAYANWGAAWRMPSKAQFDELINSSYTTTTWTTQNGKSGRKITSKRNGKSIFLPAAGFRDASSFNSVGSLGVYWTRTLYMSTPCQAHRLDFDSSNIHTNNTGNRSSGRSVRPVRASQ